MVAVALDPVLDTLLAGYMRGSAGAAEVLHDAFLERGLTPLPIVDSPLERLEHGLAVLPVPMQTRLGCASAQHVIDRFAHELPTEVLRRGLAALARPDVEIPDPIRHAVFNAWHTSSQRASSLEATRAAWAVWMLLRHMPLVALRTVRAIDAAALEAQIEIVAGALGG